MSGKGGEGAPQTPGLASRLAASEAVEAVMARRIALDEALAKAFAHHRDLADRDRAQTRLIVATALRRMGEIELVIGKLVAKPLPGTASRIVAVLATGAAQLLFLDTPAHAAIDLAVQQCRHFTPEGGRYAGLVNAVLRRVATEGRGLLEGADTAQTNTPGWLWARWVAAFGEADARRIAHQHLETPPLDLSVKGDAAGWAARLGGSVLATGSVRLLAAGRIEALEGYSEGGWWVQDGAAALPVRLLGNVAGVRVADLGAAPGGKTAELAALGAKVVAVDSVASRIERVKENLARLRLDAETVVADVAQWQPGELFPAVLLDAPCLSTGTIRRNPDVPHLKRAADLAPLTALQRRLLDAAWSLVAPGGKLVYCTCSLEPEEGVEQVRALLARHGDARLLPIEPAEVAGDERLIRDGFLRTLPFMTPEGAADGSGMDGFFAGRVGKAG